MLLVLPEVPLADDDGSNDPVREALLRDERFVSKLSGYIKLKTYMADPEGVGEPEGEIGLGEGAESGASDAPLS